MVLEYKSVRSHYTTKEFIVHKLNQARALRSNSGRQPPPSTTGHAMLIGWCSAGTPVNVVGVVLAGGALSGHVTASPAPEAWCLSLVTY